MLDSRQHTEDLMAALEFTWDDLVDNRAGVLSESQKKRLGDIFGRNELWMNGSLAMHAITVVILQAILLFYFVTHDFSFKNIFRTSYSVVVVLFFFMFISMAVVVFHHTSQRTIIRSRVHSVQGIVSKTPNALGPTTRMMTNKVGLAVGATFIAGMFVRNLLVRRKVSTRSKDYQILLGYRLYVDNVEFHTIKKWGAPFEDGGTYTIYYIRTRSFRLMVAAEA